MMQDMEPMGQEIYVARTKAALKQLGIDFHFDGRFSLDILGEKVMIDVSATAPEHIANEVLRQVFAAGSRVGYKEYQRKLKDLIG